MRGLLVDPLSDPVSAAGKRRCLGERLATTGLKLFFTSIMQNYEIVAPPGGKLNPTVTVSVVRSPNPYRVIFKPRVTNQ